MTEPRFRQQPARPRQMLAPDDDAPRQHANLAVQHAHVLIEHHVRNVRAREQCFNSTDQHRIVGANDLVHRLLAHRIARRGITQIGEQLGLAPPARDGIEHEGAREREQRREH